MEGYFKLIPSAEKQDVKYITKLPATIGRTTTVGSTEGQQVSIGPTEPTLSRYHGIITWNSGKKCFECKCNSKNGKNKRALQLVLFVKGIIANVQFFRIYLYFRAYLI